MIAISFFRGRLKNFNNSSVEDSVLRLRNALQELVDRGVRIILIRDVPRLALNNVDITTCLLQEKLLGSSLCDVSHSRDSLDRLIQDELYDKVAHDLKLETWDPRKYMIANNKYSVNDSSGREMMMDSHHITKSYSEHLADFFKSDIIKVAKDISH